MNDELQDSKRRAPLWIVTIYFTVISISITYLLLTAFFHGYWLNRQANIQAKNPSNLKHGCLQFLEYRRVKYESKSRQYFVNGIEFNDSNLTQGIFLNNAPFNYEKSLQFRADVDKYQQSKCYKVAYIHLDYIIFKKTYIYDYFGVE